MSECCVDIQAKYGSIVLNFGKFKGTSLMELSKTDGGVNYLKWLYTQMKSKDRTTPTQKAIYKYIDAIYFK